MTDLISREDAIHAVNKAFDRETLLNTFVRSIAVKALSTMPSAYPKKGKWEMKPDPFGFFHDIPVCSECGCTTKMREKTKYCPNCGADMRGEEDG